MGRMRLSHCISKTSLAVNESAVKGHGESRALTGSERFGLCLVSDMVMLWERHRVPEGVCWQSSERGEPWCCGIWKVSCATEICTEEQRVGSLLMLVILLFASHTESLSSKKERDSFFSDCWVKPQYEIPDDIMALLKSSNIKHSVMQQS